MGFHHIRFPLDIALGARGGPVRLTDVVTLSSGKEERNQRWENSRRSYNAGYGIKSRADMRNVLAFFEERRGRFHGFLWHDALDFSSSEDGTEISANDQEIGIGDGVKTQFLLVKRYGVGFDPFMRVINKPIANSVVISVDNVELNSVDFGVDEASGIVTLNAAPAVGEVVRAGFEFNVPVRFDTDKLDIELFNFDAAQVPNIPLIEVV